MTTTRVFQEQDAEVRVAPIQDFIEDREPHEFRVTILPKLVMMPVETITVKEPYYFLAASTALAEYREKRGLNTSACWSLE